MNPYSISFLHNIILYLVHKNICLARINDTPILHPSAMIVIFNHIFAIHFFITNELCCYINIISSNRFTSFELLANLLILLILYIITPILLITSFFILNIITSNRQTLIIVKAIIRHFYLNNYSRITINWIIKLFTFQCNTR